MMSGCTQSTLQPPLYLGEIPKVSIVGREGFVKGKLGMKYAGQGEYQKVKLEGVLGKKE